MHITPEMNERLTRVGPGTAMGEVMRRYWLPACLSEEMDGPDSPPIRLRLLGEDLVAFRDSSGEVGLLAAYCAHRLAPLFYGRNEECGIRCVYHGWKFDTQGNCVDMPSEPPYSKFRLRVSIKAYPVYEAGGMIWTYMGPPREMPAPPDYEWLRAPVNQYLWVSKNGVHCNYLQGIEGGIDTAHSSFLHNNDITNRGLLRNLDTHPKLDLQETAYGFMYAGIRNVSDDQSYVRIYQFCMPNQQMRANLVDAEGNAARRPALDGHIWVPLDDENTMLYTMKYGPNDAHSISAEDWWKDEDRAGRGSHHMIPGTYWTKKNASNEYMIDRELQRTKTFTGITGIGVQDQALVEGMGGIVKRQLEALGSTDRAIQSCRRLLLEACDDVEAGRPVRGSDPATYRDQRATELLMPRGADWRDAAKELLRTEW
jgi:phthalate 4,5-dioxygenase